MTESKRAAKAAPTLVSSAILDEATRALAVHGPDGLVILTDPGDWICEFVNAAASNLFGPSGPKVGQSIVDAFPMAARSQVRIALDEARRTGEPKDVLASWHHDSIFEMRCVAMPRGVVVHFRDKSDR